MNTPLLSIIIPSFNQGDFVEKTLQSIFTQDCLNIEVIVLDGGSTDNTVEILKKYDSQIDYWVSKRDKGQSHAFNKGLALAKGEWVGWQNSDDCYLPNTFSEFSNIINLGNNYDVIFADYDIIDENDKIIYNRKLTKYSPLEYVVNGGSINNCSAFFRKEKLLEVNGLDEELQYYMDHDLYLKLSQNNAKYNKIQSTWGQFRIHNASKGANKSVMHIADTIRQRYYPWYKSKSVYRMLLFILFKIRRVFLLIYNNEWKAVYDAIVDILYRNSDFNHKR